MLGVSVMLRVFRCLIGMICLCLGSAGWAEGEGQAEVPRGLWQTEPDSLGVILHVRTRRCGRALCGRVERAKNRRGYDTPSNAVGDKVLWELRPQADGSFLGEFRDSMARQYLDTRVEVRGREMFLRACDNQECRALTWTRIR